MEIKVGSLYVTRGEHVVEIVKKQVGSPFPFIGILYWSKDEITSGLRWTRLGKHQDQKVHVDPLDIVEEIYDPKIYQKIKTGQDSRSLTDASG